MNNYHVNLNIPVAYDPPNYDIPDKNFHLHRRIQKEEMGKEFKEWIYSLGLYIIMGEYFYTPPERTLEPHSDTLTITDVVKLN